MTDKPQAKNAGRTDTKKTAPKKPKEKVAALKNTQNEAAVYDLLVPNHAHPMQGKLSPEHQKEFNDALKIASIVLDGNSIEAALMQVRENVQIALKDDVNNNSLNAAINKKFSPHLGEEHLENIDFTQEISKEGVGTFMVQVTKLGQTALGRREVDGMLNGTRPKPVEYKDRELVNGKKPKALAYLYACYGHLIKAKALYAHELKAINRSLYVNLSTTLTGGLSTIMPTKSDKVSHDLRLLAEINPTAHRAMANSYGRT